MNTNTMKWLIKKELWENKGSLVWAPLGVAGLSLLSTIVGVIVALSYSHDIEGIQVGPQMSVGQGLEGLAKGYPFVGFAVIVFLALGVLFFSLNTLFDERKDKSILFWKSMPISDGQVVASKAIIALVVAPLVAAVAMIVCGLLALVVVCFGALPFGVNLFGVFLMPRTYLTAIEFLSLVPIYALWTLPAVGWLMLVGSFAQSKPFLWAFLPPLGLLMAGVMTSSSIGMDFNWAWPILGKLGGSIIPGGWLMGSHDTGGNLWEMNLTALFNPSLWIGAVVGAGMLWGAAWIRRCRGTAL